MYLEVKNRSEAPHFSKDDTPTYKLNVKLKLPLKLILFSLQSLEIYYKVLFILTAFSLSLCPPVQNLLLGFACLLTLE